MDMSLVVSTRAKGKRNAEACVTTSEDEDLVETVLNSGLMYMRNCIWK